ncbi:MAG TPA: hypothetical protein VM076_07665 [Gemmatimonadaceae bacterium]|nr:hypothetical protein [Gemmatimonadaceae bacterium]
MGALTRLLSSAVDVLLGRPVELPPQLADAYPELRHARYRLGGLPLRIGGWSLGASTVSGITLWRTIWVVPDAKWEAELLLHEIRHVQQFQASASFPIQYVWESLRRGYHANRFEVDARRYASARLARESAQPSTQDT